MKSKFRVNSMPFHKLKEQINIPKFQRGIVWNFDKRKNFIRTVLSGNPFGSLLLYQNDVRTVSLIDGLQRYSTLKSFAQKPLDYVNIMDYCKDDFNTIVDSIIKETNIKGNYAEIKSTLQGKIKDFFSLDTKTSQVVENIIKEFPFLEDIGVKTYRLLNTMLSDLTSLLDISDLEIPYILFEGDFSELPSIFEEMNSTGTKLSKYDIFSAKWSEDIFSLNDHSVLSIIDQKYQSMIEDSDTEISNYSLGDVFSTNQINLYEYCYAVGKLVKEACPNISTTRAVKNQSIESLGFLILSAILCRSTKNMHNLPTFFTKATANQLKELKDKILECAKTVDDILKEYITIPNGSVLHRYIESQVVCIITTLFDIRYIKNTESLLFKDNPNRSKYMQSFKKNMPKRYLYDIITDYWSGNGDSKLSNELSKKISDNRYLLSISAESWRNILKDLADDQLNKPMKQIPVVNRLILNYILRYRINCNTLSQPLEIDLIVPKNKFKNLPDANGICALGNLSIFPRRENRSKSDETWYTHQKDKITLSNTDEKILDQFMYPTSNELSFIDDKDKFTYDNYKYFLNNRHNYLINTFVEYYS